MSSSSDKATENYGLANSLVLATLDAESWNSYKVGLFMAGSREHVNPLNLFDLARDSGSVFTEEEKKHLHECEQCQHVLAVFVASSASNNMRTNPPRRKMS